jgi:hypothetical protein
MKQILLIIALFIGLGNVNAQSDATLEETVQWLNYYGIKGNGVIEDNSTDGYYEKKVEWKVTLNSKKMVDFEMKQKRKSAYRNMTWGPGCTKGPDVVNFDLNDIKKLSLKESSNSFIVVFYFKDSVGDKNVDYECLSNLKFQTIFFEDKKNANSLFKAMKHLNSIISSNIEFINPTELENKF